jgi:hypothetical protein
LIRSTKGSLIWPLAESFTKSAQLTYAVGKMFRASRQLCYAGSLMENGYESKPTYVHIDSGFVAVSRESKQKRDLENLGEELER